MSSGVKMMMQWTAEQAVSYQRMKMS